MLSTPTSINGFTVLPLTIPGVPSFPHTTIHNIYIRAHTPTTPDPTTPRSLFASNIPIDSTSAHFRALFSSPNLSNTRLERVTFEDSKPSKRSARPAAASAQQKSKKRKRTAIEDLEPNLPETWDREVHRSGSNAVLVFVDKASADAAAKAVKRAARKGTELVWGGEGVDDKVPSLGLARYKAHQRLKYPDHEELQASVDAYMTAFGEAEEAKKRAQTRLRQEPDEEGFVTVVRGPKAGKTQGSQQAQVSEGVRERMERKKRKEEERAQALGDFYRFQNRERKKAQAGDLVKKFGEDRKRVRGLQGRNKKTAFPE